MPTENRSSNAEMVSAKVCGYTPGQSQVELRLAECCTLPSWLELGETVTVLRPQPPPQPHPEAIAWMVGTAIWWTKEEAERDAAATGLPVVPVGSMVDTAEVERLREENAELVALVEKQGLLLSETAIALRGPEPPKTRYSHADIPSRVKAAVQQIAERDALLREKSGDLIRMAAHLISAPLFALQDLQDEDKKMTRARIDHAVDVADARLKDAAYELRRIADALSACAEPSAPVTAEEKA